jgi:D-beta-D-heptose 7-phosphate kinase/D-beta-D-heptose 1-phosphate adenosyltransferase
MKAVNYIPNKIFSLADLQKQVAAWRVTGKSIAFSNGCFDILHEGHIFSLNEAAKEADKLIIGVNSDASVKRLKGPERPINNEHSRSLILSNLVTVDAVIIFNEDTPKEVIEIITPNILVKGGDYTLENIVGAHWVIQNGGQVKTIDFLPGYSTSAIEQKILLSHK